MLKYNPTVNVDKNNNEKNKEKKKETKEEEVKPIPTTVFVPAPIFFNPIIRAQKNYNAKYQKKKGRPFAEREGDWICKNCKNLNFAFRNECNRCKMHKKDCVENTKTKEENDTTNNTNNITNNCSNNINKGNGNSNKKNFKNKKHYTNQFNEKNNTQKEVELDTNADKVEHSFEEKL